MCNVNDNETEVKGEGSIVSCLSAAVSYGYGYIGIIYFER